MVLLNVICYIGILIIVFVLLCSGAAWLGKRLNENADLVLFVIFAIIIPFAMTVMSLFIMVDSGYLPNIIGS